MARKDRHLSCVAVRRMATDRVARKGDTTVVMPIIAIATGRCDQNFPQPFRVGTGSRTMGRLGGLSPGTDSFLKGLILAQNERWRRGLGMQVARAARPVAEG
jgi:hypothetical protein